jgi:hypothetical protein
LIPLKGAAFRVLTKIKSKGYFEPPRAPRAPRKTQIKIRFKTSLFIAVLGVLGVLGGSNVFVVCS